jgi:hypothetical protein
MELIQFTEGRTIKIPEELKFFYMTRTRAVCGCAGWGWRRSLKNNLKPL